MSANLTVEDIEYLREGYRLFREHNPAFMDRFASNATFVFPTTLPAGGTYEGPWEALEFTATVSDRVDDPILSPKSSSATASAWLCSAPGMQWSQPAGAMPPSALPMSSPGAGRGRSRSERRRPWS
jgi:hypothetical protein